MNIHSLIPLIASIAYVPLLIVLFANRPWQRQKHMFVLLLVSLMLWSFGDFLFRSDFLPYDKLYVAKAVLCIFTLAFTQLHYFLRIYYEGSKPGVPVVYIIMAISFVLIAFFVPESLTSVGDGGTIPKYGAWIYPLAVAYGSIIVRDVFLLVSKMLSVTDPIVRNQITYLLLGLGVTIAFSSMSLSQWGQEYPLAHIGNFINALILTYTVLRHRLLDLRLVLRRGVILAVMGATGIAVYMLLYVGVHFIINLDIEPAGFLFGMVGALTVTFVLYQLRGFTIRRVEQLFYGGSYEYRRELNNFINNRIKGIITLDELGNELLTLLGGSIKCNAAYLMLPREDTGDFYPRFAIPYTGQKPHFAIKSDSPVVHWLKENRAYLPKERIDIAPEFKALWSDERENLERYNLQMLLPVISRDNIVGLVVFSEKQHGRSYTLEEISLAERTIRQVATSMEKEYLQDQLKKREQELSLLNQLSRVISSSLNIQDVYTAFVDELKEIADTDYTAISLIEGNEVYFAAVSGEVGSAWNTGQKIPLPGTGTEWVYLNKKSFYEENLLQTSRFWTGTEHIRRGIKSLLYVPLVNKSEVIGVLILGSKQVTAYSPDQAELLEHLAAQIAAPIENSRLFTKAEHIARIDGITELFNRRHFDERMKEEIDRHSRYGDTLALLLIDLDNFKKYNDTFGHLAGDRILIHAAKLIQGATRSSDLSFRYGGDEFAVILPHSSTVDAFNVAERMREKFSAEMSIRQLDITISIGISSWPGDGITLDELCYAADMALYYAKRTGQNRSSIASSTLFALGEPNATVNTEVEALSTIYALAATLEARDKYTYGHSRRVSRYAVTAAEALGLPPEQVALVSAAALLHDIGKIGIPDNILNKSERLLDEEWNMLKQHPMLSATIIGHVPSLSACLAAVRHHHERWDGAGYPSGLRGEAIPMEARILSVTDAFEAMISERPYRKALSFKNAVSELERCSGTQFDPVVVKAFIPIVLSTAPDEIELDMERVRRTSD